MKVTENAGSLQPSSSPKNGAHARAAPPLLEYINIGPDQRLPPPYPPPDPELTQKAERMVSWAISSKHENSAAARNAIRNAGAGGNVDDESPDGEDDDAKTAARQYVALCNLLDLKSDTLLLQATLHSIITSNSGRDMDRLVTHSKLHAQLVHSIMRLDPFVPGSGRGVGGGGDDDGETGSVGIDTLRDLDRVRRDRKNRHARKISGSKTSSIERTPRSSNKRPSVQIAESSIRHKENAKYIASTLPYFSYQIADAHLHLLITIVSSNSVLSVSAIRSLWAMLTDFGSRWIEWSNQESDRLRRERKRKRSSESKKRSNEGDPCKEGYAEGNYQPARKRRRLVSQEYATPEKKCQESTEVMEVQENESERPVPGMGGLSVEFARDVFVMVKDLGGMDGESDANGGKEHHGYNDLAEEVYWDRLTSGRVKRLLLALVNVFRLCPQSKSDLLREMSSNFPYYKTCPRASYAWYTHQCLQLVYLVPTLEGPVLSLFLDKALDMDVEIKINDKGLVTLDMEGKEENEIVNHSGDLRQELFAGEASGLLLRTKKRSFNQISRISLANSAATPTSKAITNESIFDESEHVIEISERLDSLMTLLYRRIIQITTFASDSLSSAMAAVINARRLYRQLDNVFDKKVRTTDRSKFVQFVFFVLFGRENDALEAVEMLLAKREQELSQPKEHVVKKQRESCSVDIIQTTNEMEMASEKISTALSGPLYCRFSTKLIDFFLDESHAGDVHRQTVACYLASFVSRANYVCPETVCKCVGALLRWAEVYITAQPSGTRGAGARVTKTRSSLSPVAPSGNTRRACDVHSLFYTACQASFYMMCFRGVEAIKYYREACRHRDDPTSPYADPESVNIGPKRWKFICGHELQPLKYCLESVRLEFLHLAEDLDLFLNPADEVEKPKRKELDIFLEHLWSTSSTKQSKGKPHGPSKIKASTPKQRRRTTIISTAATQEKKRIDGGVGGLGRGSNPLDSFFPFDPYLLQKSYEYVHPYYRNWEDCLLTMEDEVGNSGGEDDGAFCNDDHAREMSEHLDEDVAKDEEDCESNEGGAGDEHSEYSEPAPPIDKMSCVISLHDRNSNFETEIRRSRAMSTGSQCSW